MKPGFRLSICLAMAVCLLAGGAAAQQAEEFDDYVVHYNALMTDMIPPQSAQAYGIERSASRALINITVLRKLLDNPGQSVEASIELEARNLTGQHRKIELQEVNDQGAIYYLGTLRVRNRETFDFTAQITPEGAEEPLELKFRQEFFTE